MAVPRVHFLTFTCSLAFALGSSIPSAAQEIQMNPLYTVADQEIANALNNRASGNVFHQLFNAWGSGGVEAAASWIAGGSLTEGSSKSATMNDYHTVSIPAEHNPYGLCPLHTHAERMESARQVGGTLSQLVQAENELRAWLWSDGEDRPINPATDSSLYSTGPFGVPLTPSWRDVSGALAMFVKLPTLVLTDSGNRTTWFNNAAKMTCWQPSPLADGPMVFKYPEVVASLQDPAHRRGFYTATSPQSLNYFSENALIFLDGDRHVATRQLLEHAGFARRYPVDTTILGSISPLPAGDGTSIDSSAILDALVPVIMSSIWGEQPTPEVATAVKEYGKYGKYAIFGKEIDEWALGAVGISSKILQSRQTVSQWAKQTPFAHILEAARDDVFRSHPHFMDSEQLVADLSDASLFAGLVGSEDLVTKCVKYQQRDPSHIGLFKADPERYLIELMRFDSAVTSVTELLQENTAMFIEGRNLTLAAGSPVQVVLATSNRDPLHWIEPNTFFPGRVDLSNTLSWNGKVRDVEARDFNKAPRHCPGHCLSLKVGAAVCAKLMGSYDELRSLGKLGTAVTCHNFHSAEELPHQPLWTPPSVVTQAPAEPPTAAVLVKADTQCKSGDFYVGTFDSYEDCGHAVKAAGGKFFVFGKGWIRQGWCYIEYTESADCPQGFESHSYDFYDVTQVSMDEYLRCHAEVMKVVQSESNGNSVLGEGIIRKQQFQDSPVPLASYVRTHSYFFGAWRSVCRREFKLVCSGGISKIETYESCCSPRWWQSDCTPSQQVSFAGETDLPDRSSQWEVCQVSEDSFFMADPPTYPALPHSSNNRDCFTTSVASKSKTLREIFNACPSWLDSGLQALATLNVQSYNAMYALIPSSARSHPLAVLLGKSPESTLLSPTVFDKYTIASVVALVHLALRSYGGRNLPIAQRIAVPHQQTFLDRIRIYGWVGTPDHDTESVMNTNEAVMSDLALCVFDTLREWTFTEEVDVETNSWDYLLGQSPEHAGDLCPDNAQTCTKKQYILGIFRGYATQDGDPVYPAQMIDFPAHFQQVPAGPWIDSAEKFLAFGMLGAHRVEVLASSSRPTHQGQEAAYKVATSALSNLAVRPGFAQIGADMYFNSNLEPVMVATPSGHQIWQSDAASATWQYWKFTWRSSLFLMVTAIDHLWTTHFSLANSLAAAGRETLPPAHPLRRLLTIFTFGTIAVNKNAAHQLVGPRHLLHRSTPFADFSEVSKAAQASIPSLENNFGAFLDDNKFQQLDQAIKDTPYFADGKLLFGAIQTLVDEWFDLYESEWCDPSDAVIDSALLAFMQDFESWTMHGAHSETDADWLQLQVNGVLSCTGFRRWLAVVLFAVTGHHRHVGTVADIASDPDFSTFSWKEGEAYGRPLQHLQMALIAASTAKILPKIANDFSHLAAGIAKQSHAEGVLQRFRDNMVNVAAQIDERNAHRSIPYLQMDPNYVECSVAV
jgi:hypothetical protein